MDAERQSLLKQLPGVDRILEDSRIQPLLAEYPRELVIDKIRDHLERCRQDILKGSKPLPDVSLDGIVETFVAQAGDIFGLSLHKAINGAGVILHTALGRAPLADVAKQAVAQSIDHYCTLQADLETGKRGDRYIHIEGLLTKITGAEAALIVNNNAAATMVILNTLAEGKEAIVSRGELIEIGGAFRIPDVMERSGARLVEVGTTNRTHLKDYRAAITEETGLILRVHQSNYCIIGFTKLEPLEDLVKLTHEANLPIVDDIGSGALIDLSKYGLPKEPTVQESVQAGSDLVCFSGDKLIGGPQCGIIVGKKEYVDRIKKNQLTRALRCDKMTNAALEATLRLFLDEEKLLRDHPVTRMLTESLDRVKRRCQRLRRNLKNLLGEMGQLRIQKDVSEVGSGSLTATTIPTWILTIQIDGLSAEELAKKLRLSRPSVFGRIQDDHLILDARTLHTNEIKPIVEVFEAILKDRN